MPPSQRPKRRNSPSDVPDSSESGIQNERILVLVFESTNWDIQSLCAAASVSRKLRAVANRVLWRQMCLRRAPVMSSELARVEPESRVCGGWGALGKLLMFCCGSQPSRRLPLLRPFRGHLARVTRFSKTSGRSFITRRCREDLLYVCDPCEHTTGGMDEDDVGVFRGVFRRFTRSRTRAWLVGRGVELEEGVRCPYCGARVWSMTAARMVPRSAARRLGSSNGALEYFVCVNGHLHGTCLLVSLSSDDDSSSED